MIGLRPFRVVPDRPRLRRLPASGNTALAASALIQAALGLEFVLSGLNKFADRTFVSDFRAYVSASPGSHPVACSPRSCSTSCCRTSRPRRR